MTAADLKNYYVDLLIMEYFGLPKAGGVVGAYAQQAIADLIVIQVRDGLNLAVATGAQLDLLGQLVGARRAVPGFASGANNFSMPRYADGAAGTYVGFARYVGLDVTGHWPRYTDIPTSYIMAEGVFAEFIEFLVAVRASSYTLKELDAIFFAFFGALVKIIDNENMTMTYQHSAADMGVLFAILQYLGLLPHPAGVSYTVVVV